jgi:predicted trehalose synthase
MMDSAANRERVHAWSTIWAHWISTAFLRSYRKCVEHTKLLPPGDAEMLLLLDCYLIERACKELAFNLVQGSSWVAVPIEGLLRMVRSHGVKA